MARQAAPTNRYPVSYSPSEQRAFPEDSFCQLLKSWLKLVSCMKDAPACSWLEVAVCMLGIEPRALCLLGKCSAELHPPPGSAYCSQLVENGFPV